MEPPRNVGPNRNAGALWTRMWKPDGTLVLNRALGDSTRSLQEQAPAVEAQALQDATIALGDGAVHAIYDGDSGELVMVFEVGRDADWSKPCLPVECPPLQTFRPNRAERRAKR